MKIFNLRQCCGRVIHQRSQWPGGGAVMKWPLIAVRLLGDCVHSRNRDVSASGASHMGENGQFHWTRSSVEEKKTSPTTIVVVIVDVL